LEENNNVPSICTCANEYNAQIVQMYLFARKKK